LVDEPKCITFDCYGTLVQWHRALRDGVGAVLAEHAGSSVGDTEVDETVDTLRSLSMEQQQRPPYRDYKTVLRSSLEEVLARRGMSPRPGDGETLLSFLRDIPPHPEVPAALDRLRSQFRLAIISNSDDDLISATVASIGVPIDFVVTAEQARAYKPDHRLFSHAHARIGVTPEETVHVGMGQVTDLKVCHEMGIRVVWIDRLGETLNPDWAPDAVLPDLSGLPGLLTSDVWRT
jgi:2-haloacid dehalogenase